MSLQTLVYEYREIFDAYIASRLHPRDVALVAIVCRARHPAIDHVCALWPALVSICAIQYRIVSHASVYEGCGRYADGPITVRDDTLYCNAWPCGGERSGALIAATYTRRDRDFTVIIIGQPLYGNECTCVLVTTTSGCMSLDFAWLTGRLDLKYILVETSHKFKSWIFDKLSSRDIARLTMVCKDIRTEIELWQKLDTYFQRVSSFGAI